MTIFGRNIFDIFQNIFKKENVKKKFFELEWVRAPKTTVSNFQILLAFPLLSANHSRCSS